MKSSTPRVFVEATCATEAPPCGSLVRCRYAADNLVILSGRTVIGSLRKETGGKFGDRWAWSITCVLVDPDESPRKLEWIWREQNAAKGPR